MPFSAPHPCTYPGCANLVRGQARCDAHRQPEPDYHKPEHQKLYNTARWRRLRLAQLARQPWCEACLRANIYEPATDVDHVTPHRGNEIVFFTGKLQSLCKACHSRKTQSEVFQ